MRLKWVKLTGMGIMLLAFGCRTPQPNLKPPPSPEALSTPPQEQRFNTSEYPKEAFNARDPLKTIMDDTMPTPNPGKSMGPTGSMH